MIPPTRRSPALLAPFALALLLAGACAKTPAPFDPVADCPKVAYCGQCASRGACAWCGDPNDSSKGQCVAVSHAECSAPSAWSKTPEVCPAPPATTASASPLASTSTETPGMKAVGPEKWTAVKNGLVRAFPHANVSDGVVDAVVELILREHRAGASGAAQRESAPIAKHVQEKDHRLYMGQADHHRIKSAPPASKPLQSEFVMALPMVRVSLPEALDPEHTTMPTEIGDVDLSRDHLLGSIDLIADKYGDAKHLGYRPARVDLITPARLADSRFGAIAVYLGYRNKTDRGPSFYLLEAGTATGDAKMIYYSPSMAPIPSVTSYYLPTPFVTMRNTYSGGITMQPPPNEDEPDQLVVISRAVGEQDPYITVTVKYQRSPTMELALPIELIADAGSRVALIAKTMGISSAVELQGLLANLGKDLFWKEYPHYVAPGAAGSAAPAAGSATPAAGAAPPATPR